MRAFIFFGFLLLVAGPLFGQAPADPSFSLFFNSGLSFTHANDPHINRWLTKYGYPTEPHVPSSLQFEVGAMPVSSRQMYNIRVSVINSGKNLTSFNLLAGVYTALIKEKSFMLLAGAGIGFHRDILSLNGDMPAAYKQLASRYNKPLGLRRGGLILEPALRAFWFPFTINSLQLGLFASAGLDMDFNSRWRLGYFDNSRGKASHFKRLAKPSDQLRVSEYGLAYNVGLSIRLHVL